MWFGQHLRSVCEGAGLGSSASLRVPNPGEFAGRGYFIPLQQCLPNEHMPFHPAQIGSLLAEFEGLHPSLNGIEYHLSDFNPMLELPIGKVLLRTVNVSFPTESIGAVRDALDDVLG
jgi:hypothetical protein